MSWSRLLLLSVVIGFGARGAVGAPLAYTCDVKGIYDLDANGELKPSVLESQMRGSSFSVSRVTGEIIGEVVPTLMADKTRVINAGSAENSFKAVAEFSVGATGKQIQLLEVQEFRSGASKPFIAASMGGAGLVTGLCR